MECLFVVLSMGMGYNRKPCLSGYRKARAIVITYWYRATFYPPRTIITGARNIGYIALWFILRLQNYYYSSYFPNSTFTKAHWRSYSFHTTQKKKRRLSSVPHLSTSTAYLYRRYDNLLLPGYGRSAPPCKESGARAWLLLRRHHITVRKTGICCVSWREGGGTLYSNGTAVMIASVFNWR